MSTATELSKGDLTLEICESFEAHSALSDIRRCCAKDTCFLLFDAKDHMFYVCFKNGGWYVGPGAEVRAGGKVYNSHRFHERNGHHLPENFFMTREGQLRMTKKAKSLRQTGHP